MKLILCSAFYQEQEKLIKYFKPLKLLSYKNKYACYYLHDKFNQIYFLTTGMGYKNQVKNISYYIKQWNLNNNYLWILTGFAGAINPELTVGTIVAPTTIFNDKFKHQMQIKKYFSIEQDYCLYTVNKILGKNDKLLLKKNNPDVDLIDMEAMGFYDILKQHHINNFFICKVISDDLNFEFPDYSLIKDSIFKIKLKNLLKLIFQINKVIKLYYNMNKASKNISWFFKRFYNEFKN